MSAGIKDPKNYFNRELSWLRFNARVLEEAMDQTQPLLERIKFVSIFSSNLDEFFMIRVAGLKEQLLSEIEEPQADGIPPAELFKKISEETAAGAYLWVAMRAVTNNFCFASFCKSGFFISCLFKCKGCGN